MTDCVRQIKDALTILVDGQKVYPEDLVLSDNWGIGYKFACPYCCEFKKSYKKKQRCARVYPLTNYYTYRFSCSRCKKAMSIHKFLEDRFPLVYLKYKRSKSQTFPNDFY